MRISLPVKLGVFVILLFAVVIAAGLLFKPLKYQYWRGKLTSENGKMREKAIKALIEIAPSCHDRLVRDCFRTGNPSMQSFVIVLANSGWSDFSSLEREQFLKYAKLTMTGPARDYTGEEYLRNVRDHIFYLRPGSYGKDYYDFLYQYCHHATLGKKEKDTRTSFTFFKRTQHPDGRWLSEDGSRDGDLVTTSSVLSAFMEQGQSDRAGIYKEVIKNGMNFLKKNMDFSGRFSKNTFVQVLCTRAMCKLPGMNGDEKMYASAEKAAGDLLKRQLGNGGFPAYAGDNNSDHRATFYSFFALMKARWLGIDLSKGIVNRVLSYIDESRIIAVEKIGKRQTDPMVHEYESGKSETDNKPEFSEEELKLIAMAMVSSIFCRRKRSYPDIKAAGKVLGKNLPSWDGRRDAEYIYWGTNCKFQMGGPAWKKWNEAYKLVLLKHQHGDSDHLDGSWDPVMGKNSEKYGRVYTTAVNSQTFSIYCPYGPTSVFRRKKIR